MRLHFSRQGENMSDIDKQLDPETITTLRDTVDFLVENGKEVTGLFYQEMFTAHPELKNTFNLAHQQNGEQREALARSLYRFAENLDNPEFIQEQIINRIAHKHTSLSVQPDQYKIVGKYLLGAVHATVSKKLDTATADVITAAWKKGYWILAGLLTNQETSLYQQGAGQDGGWKGLREFILADRQDESEGITSFYLEPTDEKALPAYRPGQYISLYIKPEDDEYRQIRQYSLSDSPHPDYFRITVKREGYISQYMHDHWKTGQLVSITPPAGEFVLQDKASTPVVLLSAGVGVTPMVSVLNTVLEKNDDQQVTFVHAVQNSQTHPFKALLEKASSEHTKRLEKIVFYEKPLETDRLDKDYHHEGLINLDKIQPDIQQEGADYYLCGPVPFMATVHKKLTSWGVDNGQIHYEVFGSDKALY